MDILVDLIESGDLEEPFLEVKVAARAPLSDSEWKASSLVWPLPRPNCALGSRFSKFPNLIKISAFFERWKSIKNDGK